MVSVPWTFIVNRLILAIRLNVIGREYIDFKRVSVYICNHQSWVDVPLMIVNTCAIALSKKEVRRLPFVGILIVMSGAAELFDRATQASRIGIVKKVMEILKQKFSIMLFPEGTRSIDGKLLEANNAVVKICYKLNVPVVPSVLEGTRDILPKNRLYFKFGQKVVLKYNPPMYPKDFANAEEFADACWNEVVNNHRAIIEEYFPHKLEEYDKK